MAMRANLLINGRATGKSYHRSVGDLVKNKITHALLSVSCCNRSSENSQTNAWNVNFSNGNLNNWNNKNNSNRVRACAALTNRYVEGWLDAFDNCCARKKMGAQCVMYRNNWYADLLSLAREVWNKNYKPSTSICFVVTRPKLREVFAANFRDRVAQHWLCMRLNPLFERRFVEQGNVSFNCREGFGTLACIRRLAENTIKVSENYAKEAWYAQFDIKGFFMSIDCNRLLKYLLPFTKENWKYWKGSDYEGDLDLVLWLTEVIVRHRPQDDCERRGDLQLWKKLPKDKSLFHAKPMRGEPIGNITSQLFANFYMSYFDEWAITEAKKRGAEYVRFVDDFAFVCKRKEDALWFQKHCYTKLRTILHVRMHPDKVYIQEVKKGIKMVGGVVKPGRTYLANRTVAGFTDAVRALEAACDQCINHKLIYSCIRSVNSYMGFLVHHKSYAIRRKAFSHLKIFWKCCYIKGHFQCVKPRKRVIDSL